MKMNDQTYGVILHLDGQGSSPEQISKVVKFPASTVRYWLKRGRPPSQRAKRSLDRKGKKFTQNRRDIVMSLLQTTVLRHSERTTPKRKLVRSCTVKLRPFGSARRICRRINGDDILLLNIGRQRVSASTVWRDLRHLGLKPFVMRNGPRLEDHHKKFRVAFCNSLLATPPTVNLQRLVFTDEKWFDSDDGRSFFWASDPSDVPTRRRDQNGFKVMIWGAIGHNYRRLVRIPRCTTTTAKAIKINSRSYVDLIGDAAKDIKAKGLIFMQDNAPGHTAAVREGWFQKEGINVLEGWPANSPDLNPIETMWAIVAKEVASMGPFGEDQLYEFVQEQFHKVPMDVVNALCAEFEVRMRACVKARGNTVTPAGVKQARRR